MRADQVKHALHQKHRHDCAVFTEVKNGPTHISRNLLIMDLVAIKKSWTKPCIYGYEVKVSRSDFERDEKWQYYMQYCNKFFFACSKGLIAKEELPEQVGLVYVNPETLGVSTRKNAIFREIEEPIQMLYYLIYSRIDDVPYPFFNSKEEHFKAWLEKKESTRQLSYEVKSQLITRLRETEDQVKDFQRKVEILEEHRYKLNAVSKILKDTIQFDINGYWGLRAAGKMNLKRYWQKAWE